MALYDPARPQWRKDLRDFFRLCEGRQSQGDGEPVFAAVDHQAVETGVGHAGCFDGSPMAGADVTGSSMIVSRPGCALRAVSLPLCSSTDRRAIASPNPRPPLMRFRSESTR